MSWSDELVDAIADRVAEKLNAAAPAERGAQSPWMTTEEAIVYSRIPEGTFRKRAASGEIPSHGGRSKVFHREEVDQAIIGYARASKVTKLRRAS